MVVSTFVIMVDAVRVSEDVTVLAGRAVVVVIERVPRLPT
jgi:hypothetical protein